MGIAAIIGALMVGGWTIDAIVSAFSKHKVAMRELDIAEIQGQTMSKAKSKLMDTLTEENKRLEDIYLNKIPDRRREDLVLQSVLGSMQENPKEIAKMMIMLGAQASAPSSVPYPAPPDTVSGLLSSGGR